MKKQIRVALIHNGTQQSEDYCNQLNEQMVEEAVVVNVQDSRPIRLSLPIRSAPNVAIIYFADTLEEGRQAIDVLNQINYFKKQEDVTQLVDNLIDVAGDKIDETLQENIVNVFYGG